MIKGVEKMDVDEIALLIALEEDYSLILESKMDELKKLNEVEVEIDMNENLEYRQNLKKLEESQTKLNQLRSLLGEKIKKKAHVT